MFVFVCVCVFGCASIRDIWNEYFIMGERINCENTHDWERTIDIEYSTYNIGSL